MASRYARLHRDAVTRIFLPGRGYVFRLGVQVVEAALMPTKIFVFQRQLIDPYSGVYAKEFSNVADPFEITLYPADEPEPGRFPGFYRDDALELCYATVDEVDEIWRELQADVLSLVRGYDKLDVLQTSFTVQLGAA